MDIEGTQSLADNEPCHLCENSLGNSSNRFQDETLREMKEFLFHRMCGNCSLPPDQSLCEVCRHIRLRHIIYCVMGTRSSLREKGRVYFDPQKGFELCLGAVSDIRERAETCTLCRTWMDAAGLISNDTPGFCRLTVYIEEFIDEFDHYTERPAYTCRMKVMINWSSMGEVQSFQINLFRPKGVSDASTLFRLSRENVLWEAIISKLQECDHRHKQNHRQISQQRQPPGFRLIDVAKGCVVLVPQYCKYAALSYVWGKATQPSLEATTLNIHDLEETGFLSRTFLPATIRDAMLACSKIGVQYLWVDRLCILQDQVHEKNIQIDAMGAIYRNSYVTLVALKGNDVNCGLPGVSDPLPTPWIREMQGMVLTPENAAYYEIVGRSAWDNRGWTYQEAKLSRRLLLFSDSGIFHECHECCADILTYHKTKNSTIFSTQHSPGEYADIIDQYTKRAFTNESDILRAISGILNFQYGRKHYFGLPFAEFINAIPWKAEWSTERAQAPTKGDIFPSWSWASMEGPIIIDRAIKIALALWAVPSGHSSSLGLGYWVISPGPYCESEHLTLSRGNLGYAVATAWKEGCFPGKLPEELKVKRTWDEERALISAKWRDLSHFTRAAHGLDDQRDLSERFPHNDIVRAASLPGAIMVYTQSLRVGAVKVLEHGGRGHEAAECRLFTEQGEMIADVNPDSTARAESLCKFRNQDKEDICFDVLVLSMEIAHYSVSVTTPYLGWHEHEDTSWKDSLGAYIGGRDYPADEFSVALMIVETRKGISTRVGVTKMYLKLWIERNPQFGTFILA